MKFCIWISAEVKPDFVSRGIMWALSCDYSHIGIGLVGDDNEPHTLYHSVGEGFSTLSCKDFLSHGKVIKGIKHIPVTNPQEALAWLDGMMGKEYSESQYIGFIAPFTRKWLKVGPGALICSEAAVLFLQKFMVGGFEKIKQADWASPRDVWEAL